MSAATSVHPKRGSMEVDVWLMRKHSQNLLEGSFPLRAVYGRTDRFGGGEESIGNSSCLGWETSVHFMVLATVVSLAWDRLR